jgi:hypothetical protein
MRVLRRGDVGRAEIECRAVADFDTVIPESGAAAALALDTAPPVAPAPFLLRSATGSEAIEAF